MFDFTSLDLDHRHADALNERRWERPDSYGGHSPDGDIVAAVVHRDSDTLGRSNYESIYKIIDKAMEIGVDSDEDAPTHPYVFSARHWAVGWVDTLIVPASAPLEVLETLGELFCALADYPVVDETHLSEVEHEEAAETWANASIEERIYYCKKSSYVSIFAARHDHMPANDCGSVHLALIGH